MDKRKTIQTLIKLAEQTICQVINENDKVDLVLRFTEHHKVSEKVFVNAIKDGAFGRFGVTYKLTPQVICSWIYQYQKEQNKDRSGL